MPLSSQLCARPFPVSQSLRISPLWLVPVVLFSALTLLAPSQPPSAPTMAQAALLPPELQKASPQPLPTLPEPAEKTIRVGLSAKGAAFAVWSKQPLLITDAGQPGHTLSVKAEDKVSFASGAVARIAVPGQTGQFWSGPLQIRTSSGASGAWQRALVQRVGSGDDFVLFASDGANPRWGRPYRGALEIAPNRAVNVVALEDYLKGVVPWEMSPSAPTEALKAQAICARSNLLAKMSGHRHSADGFDVCDFDHCQGYPGAANEKPASTLAVEQTRGMVLFYKGRVADAVYGTNCGGITASDDDVWRGKPTPYLRGVRDFSPKLHTTMAAIVKPTMSEDNWAAYCAQNLPAYAQPNTGQRQQLASRRATSRHTAQLFQADDLPEFYRWSRFIQPQALAQALSSQAALKVKMDEVTEIRVLERSASGHIKRLAISGRSSALSSQSPVGGQPVISVVLQGDSQIRGMLTGRLGSTTALPSSTFVALPQKDENGALAGWILKGAGWGHGVGMCQRGAQNHALAGWNAAQILQHYFTGAQVRTVD